MHCFFSNYLDKKDTKYSDTMEDWRLEKVKSDTSTALGKLSSERKSKSTAVDNNSIINDSNTDPRNDFWDEEAAHHDHTRFSDWQPRKPSYVPSILSVLSKKFGEDDNNGQQQQRQDEEEETSFHSKGLQIFSSAGISAALEKEIALENHECFAEDVIRVWNQISQFIIQKLKEGCGVQIAGLCTITIQEEKRLVPETKYYHLIRSPVMVLSRQVVHMYKLFNLDEYSYFHKVDSVPLNLAEVANRLNSPRRVVEGVVTEVLQVFARAVVCGKKLEFPFPDIGKIQIQNGTARMKFYEEFCKKLGFELPKPNSASISEILKHPLAVVFQDGLNIRQLQQLADERESEEVTIPGNMTPLRKHIPTESYRSVFHLREVRSIHDGELLIPMAMKKHKEKSGRNKKPEKASISATADDNNNVQDRHEERSDEKKASVRRGTKKASHSEDENEYEEYDEEDLYEVFGYDEVEKEREHKKKSNSRTSKEMTDEEIIATFKKSSDKSHPLDLQFGLNQQSTNRLKLKSQYNERDSQYRHSSSDKPPKMSNAFEPKPLYEKPSITGKYDIDLVNANKGLFKKALELHHHGVTTKILGIETVKKHYARRGLLNNAPLSYDDKRFNLPSPK